MVASISKCEGEGCDRKTSKKKCKNCQPPRYPAVHNRTVDASNHPKNQKKDEVRIGGV